MRCTEDSLRIEKPSMPLRLSGQDGNHEPFQLLTEIQDCPMSDDSANLPWSRLPLVYNSTPQAPMEEVEQDSSGKLDLPKSSVVCEASQDQSPFNSRGRKLAANDPSERNERMGVTVPLLSQLQSANGNAPVIMELVRKAEQIHSSDMHVMAEIYVAAVNSFGHVQSPQNYEFRDLCVKCMRTLCQDNPAEAREFHNRLRAYGLCKLEARIYEARAAMEERMGDLSKAVKMLLEGLQVGAQPTKILQRVLERLQPSTRQSSSAVHGAFDQETPCNALNYSISTPAATPRNSNCFCMDAPVNTAVNVDAGGMQRQQDIEELRAEFKQLREELRHDCSHWQSRSCPKCCRESVGNAVDALMAGVLRAVNKALQIDVTSLLDHNWHTLTDEVWEHISGSMTPNVGARARLSRLGKSDNMETMYNFTGLASFQEILHSHAASRCTSGVMNQYATSLAATAQAESLSAPDTITSKNAEMQAPVKLAECIAGRATKQAEALRIALAEIPPSVLQEPQWHARRAEMVQVGKGDGMATVESSKENADAWFLWQQHHGQTNWPSNKLVPLSQQVAAFPHDFLK